MRYPLRWVAFLSAVFFLVSGILPAERYLAAFLLAAGWLGCWAYPRAAKRYPAFTARLPGLALAGILLLALVLRLRMTRIHIWFDEMVTLEFCRLPWDSLARHMSGPRELISPFMLFLYRFLYAFTHDPVALRHVNVLLGVVSVYMAYRIGVLAHRRATGLWFAFFLVCASQVTYFTVELRSYGLLLLTSLCSVYFYLRELREPTGRGLRWYAYSSALMVFAHFAGFAILGVQLLVWLAFWRPLKLRAREWGGCFLYLAAMGALPFWYSFVLKKGQFHYFLLSMYPQPHPATTFSELVMVAGDLFQRTFFIGLFALLAMLALSMGARAAVRAIRGSLAQALGEALAKHYRIFALAALCALPVLGLFFCRIEQRTVFYYSWRYVLPSLSLGCFFLGLAMSTIRGRGWHMLAVSVAVTVGAYSSFIQWDHKGYAYDEHLEAGPAYRVLKEKFMPGDRLAMLMNETFWHWQVFDALDVPLTWVTTDTRMAAQHTDFRAGDVRDEEVIISPGDLAPGQRVWVLITRGKVDDPAWRWLLGAPGIIALGEYEAGDKMLYLFQKK